MSKKTNSILTFLTGTALGAGVGVLFAPNKGKETRKKIQGKYKELKEKLQGLNSDNISDFIDEVKVEIENQIKELKKEKVVAVAKGKAREIKRSCDEMIDAASQAGNKVLLQTTKEFKTATVKTLKDIINKIEA